uniref:Uncharacterized protein n=1 Tax=Peronospora matthiolae TaxID=2874970 RepID=A0AAV1UUZ7_9STRA
MGPEVHDNRLAQAFCKTLFGLLKGDVKDMDMAVFGADGYNFVGFLVVRVALVKYKPL